MSHEPFSINYDWEEFRNSWKLTDFQRYRIKSLCKQEVKATIQKIINEAIINKETRREELNSHNDPNDPFNLELGGEG